MPSSRSRPLVEPAAVEDDDASRPLLQDGGQTPDTRCSARTVGYLALLLFVCLLERCTFYEYVADVLNSQPGNGKNFCGILGDNSSLDLGHSWQSQIMLGLAFLLPLLGGFAADWHCGCLRVLQVGCALYCLGAWLLFCLVYLPQVCSLAFKLVCQAVLALATGLVRPSLMVMSYDVGEPLLGPMGLCHLYYACEAIGEVLGCSLAYTTDLLQSPLTFSCVPTTHAMIGLTLCVTRKERTGWDPRLFYLPTWVWTKRILVVAAPIIMLSSVLMLESFTLSGWELTHKSNQTSQQEFITNCDLLLLIWSVTLVLVVAALALLTRLSAAVRPHTRRIGLGIVLVVVNQVALFGVNLGLKAGAAPHYKLVYVFGSQSVLSAAAEALTFVAANEIAFQIAPVEIRTFILGLFMALKGSGFFTSVLILVGYSSTAASHEVVSSCGVAVVHLALGVVLLGSLVYFLCQAPRALRWLVGREEVELRTRAAARQMIARTHC